MAGRRRSDGGRAPAQDPRPAGTAAEPPSRWKYQHPLRCALGVDLRAVAGGMVTEGESHAVSIGDSFRWERAPSRTGRRSAQPAGVDERSVPRRRHIVSDDRIGRACGIIRERTGVDPRDAG